MHREIRLLLVEDNPGDARIVRELLRESAQLGDITIVDQVRDCIRLVDDGLVDLVLLDLSLPDSQGLEGFRRLRAHAPDIPIIILSGHADAGLAERAVREGAHDFIVKGQLEGNLLRHSVQYSVLRHAVRQELAELSLRDRLTGLYNRRGFRLLADQSLRLARRNGRDSVLLLADMNDLKEINDTQGHLHGDNALKAIARSFQSALRDSDIVARFGGDEFVALAVEAHPPGIDSLLARLGEELNREEQKLELCIPLSIAIGLAPFNPQEKRSLNDLIVAADRDMYEKKQAYRKARDGR